MAKSQLEELYEAVLPEMALHGIEDTTENRLDFLTGLRDGWEEDETRSLDKSMWMLTLTMEISRLKIKLMLPNIYKQ